MNILNQPINPGGHPVFPAANKEISPFTPASVRFDVGPPRRVSGYVAVEQQLGAPPAPAPFTLDFLRSLLDAGDDGPAPPRPVAVRVVVTSAVELDARQTELIARKMRRVTGFTNLTIESAVDPSLIAGFVIVCYGTDDDGSHVIDLSVKGKLDAIKNRADSIDQTAHDHAHR